MPSQKVLEQKKGIVSGLTQTLKDAQAGVLFDYRGLTVEEDTNLRNELRKAGVDYHVVKNTLLRFASKEVGYDELDPILHGPTALAVSTTDAVAPAKVLVAFAKKHEVVSIKAGFVDGKVINVSEVKALAELPSKEELIAKIMGSLNAPVSGVVNILQGNIRAMAIALNAYAEQRAASGE